MTAGDSPRPDKPKRGLPCDLQARRISPWRDFFFFRDVGAVHPSVQNLTICLVRSTWNRVSPLARHCRGGQTVNHAVCVCVRTTFGVVDNLASYPPGRTLAAGVPAPAAWSVSYG